MQTCIRMAILAFMLMVLIISSAAQTANKAGPSPAYRCACEGPYQAYDLEQKAQRLVNQAQAIPDLQVPATSGGPHVEMLSPPPVLGEWDCVLSWYNEPTWGEPSRRVS